MKNTRVVVSWRDGLHLRQAARLVKIATRFRSAIVLRCGARWADVRSVLGVVALCATLGTGLEVEAVGDDEQEAVQAIEEAFAATDRGPQQHAAGE